MKATKETIPPAQPTLRVTLEMSEEELFNLSWILFYGASTIDNGFSPGIDEKKIEAYKSIMPILLVTYPVKH